MPLRKEQLGSFVAGAASGVQHVKGGDAYMCLLCFWILSFMGKWYIPSTCFIRYHKALNYYNTLSKFLRLKVK